MIKLIAFDLDGVLVDARELHYLALNMALEDILPYRTFKQQFLNINSSSLLNSSFIK